MWLNPAHPNSSNTIDVMSKAGSVIAENTLAHSLCQRHSCNRRVHTEQAASPRPSRHMMCKTTRSRPRLTQDGLDGKNAAPQRACEVLVKLRTHSGRGRVCHA